MAKFIFVLSLGLSIIHQASCWGSLGHRTVAYLAEKYLTPEGSSYLNNLLDGDDISDASLWPDTIRRARGWTFTKAWHYIDAKDDPPRSCGVQYRRDCVPKEGCVVSAITNMTSRIINPRLSQQSRYDALRFLLHFIGDIHQPLHTEAEGRGGNEIEVFFRNKRTNLHAVWDTDILENHASPGPKSAEKEDAAAWAEALYDSNAGAGECDNVRTAEKCALEWANEANAYICTYVLKDDVEGIEGTDVSGEYYDGAVPIVDHLVGKAGLRLGAWINNIAAVNGAQEQGAQEQWLLEEQEDL